MGGYNKELWTQVMEYGRANEKGIVNLLDEDDISTILATMEFFDASSGWLAMTLFDLGNAKYKVYDWLAMCVQGRNNEGDNDKALQVLCHSYLKAKGNVKEFIADLRESDYQMDESWTKIDLMR